MQLVQLFREAKISQLRFEVASCPADEYVLRLDVSVGVALTMHSVQRQADLVEDGFDFAHGDVPSLRRPKILIVVDQVGFQQLEDEIEVASVHEAL